LFPEDGVSGNNGIELAEMPTLQALRDYFRLPMIAENPKRRVSLGNPQEKCNHHANPHTVTV
jgi:hypothetical protein